MNAQLDSIRFVGAGAFYLEGFAGPGRTGVVWLDHILINSNVVAAANNMKITDLSGVRERATITFSGQPLDTETVTLDDGFSAASKMNDINGNVRASSQRVFEFDDDGAITAGRVAVAIGATADETAANLEAAIRAEAQAWRILVDPYKTGLVVNVAHVLGGDVGAVALAADTATNVACVFDGLGVEGNIIVADTLADLSPKIFRRNFKQGLRFDLNANVDITIFYSISSAGPRGSGKGTVGHIG